MKTAMSFTPCIIIHTGAFKLPDKYLDGYKKGAKVAVKAGYKVLMEGGTAVDAVEAAVISMENDEIFNAGFGGCITEDGGVECDASIMEGHTYKCGGVCSTTRVANPVSLARKVMEETPHCLISAEGAHKFAQKIGYPLLDDPTTMISETAKDKHLFASKYMAGLLSQGLTADTSYKHDTVGAVALDKDGHIAFATSTGGLPAKMMGRVGDTPMIGCGGYANDAAGVSTTGHGESILKVCLARQAIYYSESGEDAMSACKKAVEYMHEKVGGRGGLILIDKSGGIGYSCNTSRMCWASIRDNQLAWGTDDSERFVETCDGL